MFSCFSLCWEGFDKQWGFTYYLILGPYLILSISFLNSFCQQLLELAARSVQVSSFLLLFLKQACLNPILSAFLHFSLYPLPLVLLETHLITVRQHLHFKGGLSIPSSYMKMGQDINMIGCLCCEWHCALKFTLF